jgi:GNAT superfamily N-acetyltransferase
MSKEIREMIDKVKSFNQFVNENVNNITYKKSVDEDRTTITAFINNKKVGSLSIEILFYAYQYEFEDVFDEDTFDEIYPDSEIVKIEHIEVDDNYKNSGIGSELMKHGMKLMKKNGYNQFYLNASPIGFKGLGTMDLVEFYKKFGFKELLNQGHNVLMGVVF